MNSDDPLLKPEQVAERLSVSGDWLLAQVCALQVSCEPNDSAAHTWDRTTRARPARIP